MRIIRDYTALIQADQGASAAIGNFDGVHLGHQSILKLAGNVRPDCPLGVLTFEPHPRQYFAPDAPSFRLMNTAARAARLAKLGVDILYELSFDAALATLGPEDFAAQVIAKGLGLAHVVVGADFCFGKDRVGTAEDLQRFGAQMGFGVTIAPLLEDGAGVVSSSAVRMSLSDGHPRAACAMLGHWHRIEGPVIHGARRGRDLGYPTANMALEGLHLPAFGIYAVLVDVRDGPNAGSYHGVASLGIRPMFGQNHPNLETHLFDFSGDLYGTRLSVGLVDYLRGEERFASLTALIRQMDTDSARARAILGQSPRKSGLCGS